jgi:hypothetical protein
MFGLDEMSDDDEVRLEGRVGLALFRSYLVYLVVCFRFSLCICVRQVSRVSTWKLILLILSRSSN